MVTQAKDLLQRTSIKTMKKDIASLREADSLQEKQKISNIKLTEEPVKSVPPKDNSLDSVIDDNWMASQKDRQEEVATILQERAKKADGVDSKVKLYATETEKQQIFLFQSRKANLEKQMAGVVSQESNSLQEQKKKALAQKAEIEKKLALMPLGHSPTGEAKADENGQPQNEDLQKKRWVVENELAKIEETIKNLDQSNEKFQLSQNNIKKEIAGIDDSLKTLSVNILQREKAKEGQLQQLVEEKAEESKPESVKNVSEKVVPLASRPAFAESSGAAMEKLEKATEVEEKQRAKFMEDVERWASAPKDDQNN